MSTSPAVETQAAPPPARRTGRRWIVAALALLAWFALAGLGGPLAGKLSEVQNNDSSSYLPKDAETSRAGQAHKEFASTTTFPGFLLLAGDKTLTPQQLSALSEFAKGIPDRQIPVAGHPAARVGDYLAPGPIPVVPAQDGKAALALINFDFTKFGQALADGKSPIARSVEVIREADKALQTDGAKTYLAGPAGVIADFVTAFGGIDGILLVVAGITVLVILLVVYRSPVLPFFVLGTAGFAYVAAVSVVYLLAKNSVITLDGQGQGILSILVIGAATDYSLLLVARYREELRRFGDHYEAMRYAWRRAVEPIVASAATVILGLLCLMLADLGPTRGLGPVGAIGIAGAMLAALTFLPALLVLLARDSGVDGGGEHGRWVFWPSRPHVGTEGPETTGIWARVAGLVSRRPRRVWAATALVLLALAAFLPTLKANGIKQSDTFRTTVESVTGGEELAKHFPAGSGSPTLVIGPSGKADAIKSAVLATSGVAAATWTADQPGGTTPKVAGGNVELQVTLSDPADSLPAGETVKRLRSGLDTVGTEVIVGGNTAANVDVRATSARDRNVVIPAILLVIFLVLVVLLRAVVAPLLLIVANVLSFAATMGAAALVFNHVFGYPGSDSSVTLYGFVFLVALGIDYSIFLMTRVREESQRVGTRRGVLTGLSVTGGVITSAGIVLAATFAALGVLPILFLQQIAFIVAFGVLLDTMVVRSLLVPALSLQFGRRIWAPGKLAKGEA